MSHSSNSTSLFSQLELRRHRRFDLIPRQARCQHRQGVVPVDHGVNATAEKVTRLHLQIPRKSILNKMFPEGFGAHNLHKKTSVHGGLAEFCRTDSLVTARHEAHPPNG